MESLYRKYRPQTFGDVVGQSHVVSTLEHAVLEGRVSHAYLFCGPRGTGKTTMARILAKSLLCDMGADHLPDGTCEQCLAVAEGTHPDVYELDAASRTGVDSVREEIINSVGYAPVRGRSKIYIIDEVHMLTTQAFNALLKTLEEPPEHVTFVMCTTDPQMIPETILSRVQRFDFKSIGQDDIRNHLAYICDKEGFEYNSEALDLVVRHARGGMRDALSSLEQLSVFGNGAITLEDALDMLGVSSSSQMHDVAMSIAQRDGGQLFNLVDDLVNNGADLLHFTRQLCVHMRNVYVYLVAEGNKNLLDSIAEDKDEIAAEAQAFGSFDRVSYIIAQLSKTASEMRYAPDQRLILEACMVRLTRPESDLTLDALASRISELEGQLADLLARPVTQQVVQAPSATAAPASKPAQSVSSLGVAPLTEAFETVIHTPEVSKAPQSPVQNSVVADDATPSSPDTWEYLWKEVTREVEANAPHLGELLKGSQVVADDGEVLKISLPPKSPFALRALQRDDASKIIIPIVKKSFNHRRLNYIENTSGISTASPSKSASPTQVPEQNVQAADKKVDSIPTPSAEPVNAMSSKPEGVELPPWEQEAPQQEAIEQIEVNPQESAPNISEESIAPASDSSDEVDDYKKVNFDNLTEDQRDAFDVVTQAFGEGVEIFNPATDDDEIPPFNTQE